MFKYLTLILLPVCFPAIIPGWRRKKKTTAGNIWFSFFLGKWAHVIWSWNNPILIFFFFYYSIATTGFFSPDLVPNINGGKCFYTSLSISGFISVLMAKDKMADHFSWPAPASPPPDRFVFLFFFFFHSRLPPSSIFLFFLNVIVKVFQWDDSKYVYINRGNTLGYILLTSCVVFLCQLLHFQAIWIHAQIHIFIATELSTNSRNELNQHDILLYSLHTVIKPIFSTFS